MQNQQENKPTVHVLTVKTMLEVLDRSRHCPQFMKCYSLVNGEECDVLKNGKLSCAFFVTSILTMFGFLNGIQLTVHRAIRALIAFKWFEISESELIPGCIIVWKEKMFGEGNPRKHIGIYVGNEKAVSNDSDSGFPTLHDYREYKGRGIETIYSHARLQYDTLLLDFVERQSRNQGKKRVNNGSLMAGSPMHYYCCACGEEMILPELHPSPAPSHCTECRKLILFGLM